MKIGRFAMILAGLGACALMAGPAEAAKKKRYVNAGYSNNDRTYVRWQDENGRTRTRVIIQKRSFLDAGTSVQRGERKYTDYVIGPTYSATFPIDNTPAGRATQTLPGPFDLPSKNNPRQW